METLVWIVHVLAALGIIGLVLLQHGKGADMGAAFGGGASGSLFGATGSANFLSRATAVLAVVFFLTSLGLTYMYGNKTEGGGVMAKNKAPSAEQKSATPADSLPAPENLGSKAQDIPK